MSEQIYGKDSIHKVYPATKLMIILLSCIALSCSLEVLLNTAQHCCNIINESPQYHVFLMANFNKMTTGWLLVSQLYEKHAGPKQAGWYTESQPFQLKFCGKDYYKRR